MELPLAHLKTLCCDGPNSQPLKGIMCLMNKRPKWNSLHGLHTLEFEGPGRVTEASRKNIALLDVRQLGIITADGVPVTPGQIYHIGGKGSLRIAKVEDWSLERGPRPLLQIGKVGEDRFSLDFRPPFSPFQAMVIAIAAFEG